MNQAPVREVSPLTIAPQRPSKGGLSIVIVTYNSAAVLPDLLDSLPEGLEGIEDFETIVVDNDSRDASIDIALAHPIRASVVQMGRNAGYAAAVNAGAAAAKQDNNLLILNPDIRLHRGVARMLVDKLTDPKVGVSVPRIFDDDGTINWSIRREPSIVTAWTDAFLGGRFAARLGTGEMVGKPAIYENEGSIDWATGAILAVSAKARNLVGDWDESFFLYMEEVDYMRRVRERGLSVMYVPQAQATHIGGEYVENPRLYGLLTANRIRYHRRHHGRLSTAAFSLSIILGEGLRALFGSAGHRAAVKAALRPSNNPTGPQSARAIRPTRLASKS